MSGLLQNGHASHTHGTKSSRNHAAAHPLKCLKCPSLRCVAPSRAVLVPAGCLPHSQPGAALHTDSHTLRHRLTPRHAHLAYTFLGMPCARSGAHVHTERRAPTNLDAARKPLSTSNIKPVWAPPAAHSQLSHTTTLSQYCIVCDSVCPTATRATRFGKLRSLTPSPCPRPSAGWRTYLAAPRSPRRLG